MQHAREAARQVLEQRRAALLSFERIGDGNVAGPQLALLSELERLEMREIESALARFAAGTFGRCEACQRDIGRERLHAMPEGRECDSCAAKRA